jgi:uncharacterized protein YbaP (TraB family)
MKIIFKSLILSIVITLASIPVSAQNTTNDLEKEGLLWEISGKGLKEPSYLFGTYHLIGKSFLDTLPGVMRCLNQAKSVAGEIIMQDEMAMAQKLMPLMMLKDTSLDKILSPKEYSEVDTFIRSKTAMSLKMLNGMKPVAVQLTLVTLLSPRDVSPQNPALDMYFQTEAKNRGMEVIGFETIEEQAGILFNSTMGRQKELLLKTVREYDRVQRETQALYTLYKHQDIKAIETAFSESFDYTVEEMDAMLSKRNKEWAIKMPSLMAARPTFFAVGAAHLPGKDGLIYLLRLK